MSDPQILVTAVEEYIASMSKPEFDAFVAVTRDPEENKTTDPAADETDSSKIAARMFGVQQ